jgi:hypothetical protein
MFAAPGECKDWSNRCLYAFDPDYFPSDEEDHIAIRSTVGETEEENVTPKTVVPQVAEGGLDQVLPLYLCVFASQPNSANAPSWKLVHNNLPLAVLFTIWGQQGTR